jgi:glucokinase
MQVRAGIDIGGTKVRVGFVDDAGGLVHLADKLLVSSFSNGHELVAAVAEHIKSFLDKQPGYELIGVGIGSPGPLDAKMEMVLDTPNTPIIQNFPMVESFRSHFSCPVRMNNDANVFVLGEAMSGAGKGEEYVYGITLGTGYGHGFVWAGQILSGAHGTATEYSLAPYNDGTFEDYVSGPALERHYKSIAGEHKSGLEIFELAESGDANALAAWSLLGRAVGHSLVYVNHLLDPGIIIVGGSLVAGFDYFIGSLREVVDAHLFPNQLGKLKIVPAELGDAAPVIGAASLIR